MTKAEWELRRQRVILTAFQTGRPVFADSDGILRFADGDGERVPDDVGVPRVVLPEARAAGGSWWTRLRRWLGGRS